MRPWSAILTCVSVLLLGAGCTGLPAGHDLTGDWPPLPAATPFRPAAGVCHDDLTRSGGLRDYAPIPCAETHVAETGAVVDLPAAGATPAAAGAEAFRRCSRQVDAFLGGDWRTGWLIMQPVLPSAEGWRGGARWARCDLAEISPVDSHVVDRRGSLAGGLRADSALRMTCADPRIAGERVTEMHPVTCSGPHTSEFAGLFASTAGKSGDLPGDTIEKGCDTAIAAFAGIPDDSAITARVGWLGFPPDDTSWQSGDHAIRCFLWLNGETMTGSYRGAGPAKLKIQYAD